MLTAAQSCAWKLLCCTLVPCRCDPRQGLQRLARAWEGSRRAWVWVGVACVD
ncbi:hypothetical protein E2C01_100996 [Portunus trituberculatus]|uniref:Uncharacterized protein n=1 Tax=Portunus trituberculatus TaxID=210409 RepID=A0A5B7KER6_PORTR|nr:hypothetical protein [Portunus trituberculatus]